MQALFFSEVVGVVGGWMRLYGMGRPQVICCQLSCKCKSSWEISSPRACTFSTLLRKCLKEDSHQITQRFMAGNVPQTGFQIPTDLQMHQIFDSLSPFVWGQHTQMYSQLLIQSYRQKVSLLKHDVRGTTHKFIFTASLKQLRTCWIFHIVALGIGPKTNMLWFQTSICWHKMRGERWWDRERKRERGCRKNLCG